MEKIKGAVLITGGARGLGLEFAHQAARQGADLVLVNMHMEQLNLAKAELEQRYQVKVHVFVKDLTLPDAVNSLYYELQALGIQVEVLINNAGIGEYGPFQERPWTNHERLLGLNIVALSHLSHIFLADMLLRKRGRILNVSSVAAFVPGPLMATYYASKAFVLSFSLALASELKDTGVSCTVLCPGPTRTGFMKDHGQDTWLSRRNFMASAEHVAHLGFQGMMQQEMLVVPGAMNNLVVRLSSILPPTWGARLLHALQKMNRK